MLRNQKDKKSGRFLNHSGLQRLGLQLPLEGGALGTGKVGWAKWDEKFGMPQMLRFNPSFLKFQHPTSEGSQYCSSFLNDFTKLPTQNVLSLWGDLTLALLGAG